MNGMMSHVLSIIEGQARESLMTRFQRVCNRSFQVLVADDCADDHFLIKRALERTLFLQHVGAVHNGIEVQQYLSGDGKYSDRGKYPFPDLLLLDLDMPGRGGLEVLRWLQRQGYPGLRVVILSSLLDSQRVETAIELGAEYVQIKPAGRGESEQLMHRLELLMVVTLLGERTRDHNTLESRLGANRQE